MKAKALFNWSGGKDSALCLYKILQSDTYDIHCLLTSVNAQHQRISMHGVRVDLLEAQATALGIPLLKMELPEMPSMAIYEQQMSNTLYDLKKQGVQASIFGDIFLTDLRQYREEKLASVGLKGVFPLWNIPTHKLIREFLDLGFKTITTCVNAQYLDEGFVGRIIDEDFLKDLPSNVDPCGENGEFHTFVFDGPLFQTPILFERGEVVYRTYNTPSTKEEDSEDYTCGSNKPETEHSAKDYGFWYCDLLKLPS